MLVVADSPDRCLGSNTRSHARVHQPGNPGPPLDHQQTPAPCNNPVRGIDVSVVADIGQHCGRQQWVLTGCTFKAAVAVVHAVNLS
jgi:hypothetical protein